MEKLTIENDILILTTDDSDLQKKVLEVYLKSKQKIQQIITVPLPTEIKPKLSSKQVGVQKVKDQIITILKENTDGLELKEINDELKYEGNERARTPYYLKLLEAEGSVTSEQVISGKVTYWTWKVKE